MEHARGRVCTLDAESDGVGGRTMGRGKYKKGPTGRRHFSSAEELAAEDAERKEQQENKGKPRRQGNETESDSEDEGPVVRA